MTTSDETQRWQTAAEADFTSEQEAAALTVAQAQIDAARDQRLLASVAAGGAERAAAAEAVEADAMVPLLTDVLQVQAYPPDALPASLDDVDWTALTQRVRDNVLDRLMRSSGQLLESQLANSLQVVVDRAMASLSVDLRDSLNNMVKDIVAKAVDEEISRVHTKMNQRAPL